MVVKKKEQTTHLDYIVKGKFSEFPMPRACIKARDYELMADKSQILVLNSLRSCLDPGSKKWMH